MDKNNNRNQKNRIKTFFWLFLLIFLLLSFEKFALAQDCTQDNEGEKKSCNDCGIQVCKCEVKEGSIVCSWSECKGEGICCDKNGFFRGTDYVCDTESKTQYKCAGTKCGDDILKRNCSKKRYCSGTSASCTGSWSDWICGSESIEEDCKIWQKCKDGTTWKDIKEQSCQCEGECLEKPKLKGLFNGKDYVSNKEVNLPVKFDWEDVNGAESYFIKFKGEGSLLYEWTKKEKELEEGIIYLFPFVEDEKKDDLMKDINDLLPFYWTLSKTEWEKKVEEFVEKWTKKDIEDKKEAICNLVENWAKNKENYKLVKEFSSNNLSKSEYTPESCFFRQNSEYSFKVIPCCNKDGTNCKPEKDVDIWNFSTSLAPEPSSPLDPDFEGENFAQWKENKPVILDWCNVKNAEFYKIKFYLIEDDKEKCHPVLCDGYYEITKNTYPPYDELTSFFEDTSGYFFISNKEYKWQVASCFPIEKEIKCFFSQKWGLKTGEIPTPGEVEEKFTLVSPLNNSLVGLPVELRWKAPAGINSFWYRIMKRDQEILKEKTTSRNLVLDYPTLSLNEEYKWQVQPCTDYKATECKNWSDFWTFKTTGAPPNLLSPFSNQDNVVLPVNFDWIDVGGAKSYIIQISKDQNFTQIIKEDLSLISEIKEDFPSLKQNSNYWWRVKSCARSKGEICGEWSEVFSFKTFKLASPENLLIKEGNRIEEKTMVNFSWSKILGSRAYQIEITSSSGKKITKITSENYLSLSTREFPETGDYNFKVRACLDSNCSEEGTSDWSNSLNFFLSVQAPKEERGGLVPCGRPFDDPATKWDEREICGAHHLFLLLENVLDLILWKIAIIFIIVLIAILGFLLYISMGNYEIIWRVRNYLKFALIGYALIFGAWLIISILLSFMGYQIKIFGHWWEIKI